MAVHSVSELVERQGRRWEFERRGGAHRVSPCIALSRLPCSGGAELGRRLAERLDFVFFGIEIVDQMARELGIQRHLVAQLDERVRPAVDRYLTDSFRPSAVTESTYLHRLVRILTTIGERGRAVILGRGSCYVLRPERTLRVLVVAPRAYRIGRLAREAGIPRAAADKRLGEEDEKRREFIGHHFGVDPDNTTLYDLVVNTATLGLGSASEVAAEALRHKVGDLRRSAPLQPRS